MKNRSVIELMVLMFSFVVGFAILATGATVSIIEILHPEVDTDAIVQSLFSLVSGILGALLGLIAGKSEAVKGALDTRPKESAPIELTEREHEDTP